MEWSLDNSNSRYTVNFFEKDGLLSLSQLISDGQEIDSPNISFTKDQQHGKILVELDGVKSYAHVSRNDEEWWIHFQGRIYVTNMHEPGSNDSSLSEGKFKRSNARHNS